MTQLLARFDGLLDEREAAALRAAAASDQLAWSREFGLVKDVARLGVERNVLRYRPALVTIRSEGSLVDTARVLVAAKRAGARVTVSAADALPAGIDHVVESCEAWLEWAASERPGRIRLVGMSASATADAVHGDPGVAIYAGPVTASGRVELLPFLREQAIAITHHRYGLPDHTFDAVLPRK